MNRCRSTQIQSHWLARAAAGAIAIAAFGAQQPAFAQQPPIKLEIPSQPLSDALLELSRQANVGIVASTNLTRGRTAPPVSGALAVEEALGRLLEGSGLSYRKGRGNSYVVEAQGTGEFGAGQDPAERAGVELEPEAIVVTGSHIRGANKPVGGQLIAVDRKEIQRSGYSSIRDLSEHLPQNFGSGATGEAQNNRDSSGNAAQGSTFNLRGLGQAATLSLINGRRVPTGGAFMSVSDISTVPLVAIERVEVLPDGASAVYGSDAVAGVVNIILRKDFEGQETTARYGFTTQRDNLDEFLFSHAAGTAWERGSVLLSYEFHHRDHLLSKDRRYSASRDFRAFGGLDHRAPYGKPGNILTPTGGNVVLYALPPGQNGQGLTRADLLPATEANYNEFLSGFTLFPSKRQHSLFGYLAQELSDALEFYVEGRYANRKSRNSSGPSGITAIIPPNNPYYFDAYGTGEPVRVAYSLDDPFRFGSESKVLSHSVVAGLDVSHPWNWMTRSYVAYSQDRIRQTYGTYSIAGIDASSNSSDPATAFNPFGDGPVNGPGVLDLISNQNRQNINARTMQVSVTSDGPLLDLFGRTLLGAIGTDYRYEKFSRDAEDKEGPYASNTFKREVLALFGELRAPLVGTDNAVPGVKSLDLSFSLRYDHYNDSATRPVRLKRRSQSTTNPRAGVSWVPVAGVRLNGSYGTSFRAPRLDVLASSPSLTTQTYHDSKSLSGKSHVLIMGGVAPELRSETADTWSFGLDLNPTFIPKARLQASYFNINFRDQIANPASPQIMLIDAGSANLVTRDPSLTQIKAACSTVDPSQWPADSMVCTTGAGIDAIIDSRMTNLSRTKIDGLDVQMFYTLEFQTIGQLDFSVNATRLFRFEQALTDNSPAVERKNTATYPVKFRARGNVSWSPSETMSLSLFANYFNDYQYAPNDDSRIDAWTTFDLTATYQTSNKLKAQLLQNLSFQIAVQNLLDQSPPLYGSPNAYGYDYANADPLGRFVSITVKKSW